MTSDYHKILNPIFNGKADVVFGSRFVGSEEKNVLYFNSISDISFKNGRLLFLVLTILKAKTYLKKLIILFVLSKLSVPINKTSGFLKL